MAEQLIGTETGTVIEIGDPAEPVRVSFYSADRFCIGSMVIPAGGPHKIVTLGSFYSAGGVR